MMDFETTINDVNIAYRGSNLYINEQLIPKHLLKPIFDSNPTVLVSGQARRVLLGGNKIDINGVQVVSVNGLGLDAVEIFEEEPTEQPNLSREQLIDKIIDEKRVNHNAKLSKRLLNMLDDSTLNRLNSISNSVFEGVEDAYSTKYFDSIKSPKQQRCEKVYVPCSAVMAVTTAILFGTGVVVGGVLSLVGTGLMLGTGLVGIAKENKKLQQEYELSKRCLEKGIEHYYKESYRVISKYESRDYEEENYTRYYGGQKQNNEYHRAPGDEE